MTASLEERLFTAERLLAALLRERAGVATDSDLHLLQSSGVALGRMVREPAPPPAPVHQPAPVRQPVPGPVHTHASPPPPPRPRAEAWDAPPHAYDDLVPGPRRHAPASEPSGMERWLAAQMKATPGDWIARAGMALLLFGIAFLCKYSIDRGWITPALRVSAGAAAGGVLMGLGVWTRRKSRPFSGLFLGGAIGAWYTAGFAAYELYHLLPFPIAFALMTATTAAAFSVAMWSRMELLAVVGTLGGIGTPFVLTTNHPSATGLVAYLLCIVAWNSGLYLAWRWRVSFMVATVGTWMALGAGISRLPADGSAVDARVALSVGLAGVLLAAWGVFLLPRAWPARFPPRPGEEEAHRFWAQALQLPVERVAVMEGYLAVLVPFLATWPSLVMAWTLSARQAGVLGLGAVAVTALAYAALRTRVPALARAHACAAAVAGAVSLGLMSRDVPEGVMVLAAYGAVLHALARRAALGRPFRLLAHGVMAVAATAVMMALVTPGDVATRLALLTAAVCAYAVSRDDVSGVARGERDGYRLAGHAFAALLVWALCWPLPVAHGGWLAVSLAIFAAALCYLERQPESGRVVSGRPVDGTAAVALHVVALATVWGLCGQFGSGAYAWYNERTAAELVLIGSLAAGAVLATGERRRHWLIGAAYVLWLFAAADQFDGMDGGAALTTGTWAATGLALLMVAVRGREQRGVRVALGTLALVCAKLFMVDLANLDPIWRILVFLGVGAAFLAVSYSVRSAWLAEPDAPADVPERVSLAGQ